MLASTILVSSLLARIAGVSALPATLQDLVVRGRTVKGANSTYHNPVLPGWHSDPSCVHVKGVTYCCTSTFESFPGMPIYASRDLVHWEHISNTWNREEQLPGINFESQGQQDGFFAPNLRYRDGQFYMTSVYAGVNTTSGLLGTVFSTSNPYSDAAWSRPLTFDAPYRTIDPDLFWDDDGSTYLTWSGVSLQPIDLSSGELGDKVSIWNGTGGVFAEGPHMYRKDGYYYLLVAEGGTQLGHMATVARSKDLRGPYESDPANPLITAVNTSSLFQTVGHADLFQDDNGNWWGMALGTRSGPEYSHFPMGREAHLFPVTWAENEFPYASPVSGTMEGWPLPDVEMPKKQQNNAFVGASQSLTFAPGSKLPMDLMYFRYPPKNAFAVSAAGHPNALQVSPSRSNLTGDQASTDSALTGVAGLSFLGRRQEHTLFQFSVELCLETQQAGVEAGATLFLQQWQHLDVAAIRSDQGDSTYDLVFRTTNATSVEEKISIKTTGDKIKMELTVNAVNATHYLLAATVKEGMQTGATYKKFMSSALISSTWGPQAGSGAGGQVGIYATTNGGAITSDHAYFSNLKYRGLAQEIDYGTYYAGIYA
ncbi:glycoside hydrolase family 43 protein [Moesziomyces antarcticus]|uniref:Glycoside hydrolase family 43 protein n=2 Tax=Pseudozyma antarctica TaxID=84753 RepID=A0A081CLF6_PSEA2|nr:glycoside hydrolase family 43 protein [Moesziomyces antarcticus]GAK67502.1 glycoside hydrolase family 43 protein [Moesziomyces antarcticus]SPO48766.1 related to xylosidase/arabinosidase [Moesziomyces antarcticus]